MRYATTIAIVFAAAAAFAGKTPEARAFDAGNTTYILAVPAEGEESALFGGDYVVTADGTVVTNNPHAPVRPAVAVAFSDGKTSKVRLPEEGELASARRHHGGKWEEVWINSSGEVVSNAVADVSKYRGITGDPKVLPKSERKAKRATRPKPQQVLHFEESAEGQAEADAEADAEKVEFKPATPDASDFTPMHKRYRNRARRSLSRKKAD